MIFHPKAALGKYKDQSENFGKFDVVWIAQYMTNHLPNLVPLAKVNAKVLVELRKFMIDSKKGDLQEFTKELVHEAKRNGLQKVDEFDSEMDTIARFIKSSDAK